MRQRFWWWLARFAARRIERPESDVLVQYVISSEEGVFILDTEPQVRAFITGADMASGKPIVCECWDGASTRTVQVDEETDLTVPLFPLQESVD